jgi:hypothetical protein
MKFVIVCSTRTGSTMLNSAFNDHPDISGFDEAVFARDVTAENLNPPDPFIKYMRRWRYTHSLWYWYKHQIDPECPRDITSLVDKKILSDFIDWLYSLDKHVVFKLLWDHIIVFPFIVDLLKEKGVKVIYLTRDPQERVASMRAKFKIRFKTNKKLLKQTQKESEDIERWFPEHLKITYEEITQNTQVDEFPKEVSRKICNYLELPYYSFTAKSRKVR